MQKGWTEKKSHVKALLSLLALCLALKAIVLVQKPLLARDGIAFIQYAHDLAHRAWPETMRERPYHPAFPIAIYSVSCLYPLAQTATLGPEDWQWCAHLAASVAGVLLVFPLYGLACCVLSQRLAWLGTALFLILPATVQITTDALAESWLLLFEFSALWCLVLAIRRQQLIWFGLAGLLAGCGFLFRIEALVIPAGGTLLLLTRQWWSRQSFDWRLAGKGVCCLVLGFAAMISPYVVLIGKLSSRPSINQLLQSVSFYPESTSIADSDPLFASRLQDGVNGLKIEAVHLWDALKLVIATHGRAGHYFLWPFALIGLVVLWKRRHRDPSIGLLSCVALLHLVMLLRLAYSAHYTSERHTLLLIALAALLAGTGLVTSLYQTMRWLRTPGTTDGAFFIPFMMMALVCLPKAIQPLHGNQEGHREAGHWLAHHLQPHDLLIDPYHWASFYAGRAFGPAPTPLLAMRTVGLIDVGDNDLNRNAQWNQNGILASQAVTLWTWPDAQVPKLILRATKNGQAHARHIP